MLELCTHARSRPGVRFAVHCQGVGRPWRREGAGVTMPDPVPVMVLARLAIDHRDQGIKLGAALLQDAVNRAVTVSQNAGVRALLVHALHDRAKQFYEHFGFQETPQHPMTLMLRMSTVK